MDDDRPLSDAEADTLLRPMLASGDIAATLVVLAVSGGVDSMALMHLVAGAATRLSVRPPRLLVATVDHGLRPGSADDAAFVARAAAQLGLDCSLLTWTGAKPTTGIQAAARMARYGLLASAFEGQPEPDRVLATAHTRDDQAETVLMRLARGSGVDGLAAMASMSALAVDEDTAAPVPARVVIRRPFLGTPKARLVATMRARGLSWRDDPSNDNSAFERVRIRQAMAALADLGITPAALARTAERMARASDALRSATRRVLADEVLVRLDGLGSATLSGALWEGPGRVPPEIQLRVLDAVIRHIGGQTEPVPRLALEAVHRDLWALDTAASGRIASFATTLGYTKILTTTDGLLILREPGRPARAMPIAAGQTLLWDNRVIARCEGRNLPSSLRVAQLGAAGLAEARARGIAPAGVRADIVHTVPAFWAGDTLIDVPLLRPADAAGPVGRMALLPRRRLLDRASGFEPGV